MITPIVQAWLVNSVTSARDTCLTLQTLRCGGYLLSIERKLRRVFTFKVNN